MTPEHVQTFHEVCIRVLRPTTTSPDRRISMRGTTSTELAQYWLQVLLVREAYRQITHTDRPFSAEVLQALDPGYRWRVERRCPERLLEGAT
ncbi:hypothetical protein [Nonomuraea sp. NPDC003709]|uniref:hypothetical protein n=1 Tax=Nonomuraea sp. NPDC003709 TaxID=3154450 RepID=UPI0033A8653E